MRSDLFQVQPYSFAIYGDLAEYLREREFSGTSNMFFGPQHYFEMKDRGLLIPRCTSIRVGHSPAPDFSYFVNADFLLESRGSGEYNMSCIGAEKGVYDPSKVLLDALWSIDSLKLWED